MHRSIIAIIASAAVWLAAPALGASQKERDDCSQSRDDEVQMKACYRVMNDARESPHNRAVAYVVWGANRPSFQLREAIADFDCAIKLDPKYARAYVMRGAHYSRLEQYDRAIADYDQAIRVDPKDEFNYASRGRFYEEIKKDLDRAIADYSEAIKLNPKIADYWKRRARLWADKKDVDHAIADYEAVIKVDPKDDSPRSAAAELYYRRADEWSKKRDFDHAIVDYSEAIRVKPDGTAAYFARAIAYMAKQDFDHAIGDYSEAIRISSSPSAIGNQSIFLGYFHKGRADAWFAKGDIDRAIADLGESITLSPSADYFTARCWMRAMANRDLTPALADCNDALRLSPNNNIGAMLARGLVYLRLGRLDDAIADYDAAFKVQPRHPYVLYVRGLAKLKKGDRAGGDADIAAAKAIWDGVAAMFAKFDLAPASTAATAAPAVDCAQAEAHWKSAETLNILAGYEDHLQRFPACAFADMARAKIKSMKK